MKKLLAASLVATTLAIPSLAPSASAQDVVQEGRTIEAFLGSNLINVQNYPANKAIAIDVLRNGVVVSSVTAKTDGDGFAEFNHVGGGQFSEGGDCFKPPASPDVMPGDIIRTRTAGDPAGVRDSAVVRGVGIDFDSIETDPLLTNTITVSGHVDLDNPDAPIVPGADVLELRLNKDTPWDTGPGLDQDRPGRRDLRVDIGENVQPDGSWTRTLQVSNEDANEWNASPGEVFLEWSAGAVGEEEASPPAIFVADEAEGEALAGCPPFAEYAVTSSGPKVINIANVDRGLRLSGISKNASAVSVTLDDRDAATDPVELTGTLRAAHVEGFQTWKTDAMTAQQRSLLRLLDNGMLTASATYTVEGADRAGANLRILKDTVAPRRAPTATPDPGVYPRTQRVTLDSQRGTEIHYTLDGSRPTLADPVPTRPIRVASTKKIKAVAFDRAGNASPVGAFRYVIRR